MKRQKLHSGTKNFVPKLVVLLSSSVGPLPSFFSLPLPLLSSSHTDDLGFMRSLIIGLGTAALRLQGPLWGLDGDSAPHSGRKPDAVGRSADVRSRRDGFSAGSLPAQIVE